MTELITDAGRDLLDHSVQYEPPDAGKAVTAEAIAKVEAGSIDLLIDWLDKAFTAHPHPLYPMPRVGDTPPDVYCETCDWSWALFTPVAELARPA